ncbi:YtrH family sporulation protein [Paludifilum halophilum]|uniref:Sporulation protein n=1 Tax=Paludifilum halophilum TaxID=1642702 RepID=A0A235B7Y7_9BACL|nr:YtrH family sporulation protein [Paludifilum halophilum]OYD08420.1 sporulation protein [Paludifilum halophilum]
MGEFWSTTVLNYFIALGVVLGGALLGGIGAFLGNTPPMNSMEQLSEQLKIWALVAALGGTFDTIRSFEVNILGGQLNQVAQQLVFILSAFFGAHTGTVLIRWFIQGEL